MLSLKSYRKKEYACWRDGRMGVKIEKSRSVIDGRHLSTMDQCVSEAFLPARLVQHSHSVPSKDICCNYSSELSACILYNLGARNRAVLFLHLLLSFIVNNCVNYINCL